MISSSTKPNRDAYHKIEAFFHEHASFSVPPATVLINSYERPSSVFFIEEGIVKQTTITSKGQQLCVNLYKPESFLPLMDVIADIPNTYTFTTVLPTAGWKAPSQKVREFVAKNADVSFELNRRLLKGLHGLLVKTEKLMQGDATALLAQSLLTLSLRFQKETRVPSHIGLPLTHQELADITGLSRETVTRELNELKRANMLVIEHHLITLTDIPALQRLAQSVIEITV